MYNRLQPHESYINGHLYIPGCVSMGESATVCRCKDGRSLFNCTTDYSQQPVKIFPTTGTYYCSTPNGFVDNRRRKRAAGDEEVLGDDVILPDDIPVPPAPNNTDFPPLPTWPTASGITEQQARNACLSILASSPLYDVCREHVDLEPIVSPCVLNIQVSLYNSISSSSRVKWEKPKFTPTLPDHEPVLMQFQICP